MTSSWRRIPKSVHSPEQRVLRELLALARNQAGLTQYILAERLGKHQSFVAKYEGGERRLDVVEFIIISRAMGADPARLFRALIKRIG